jgi:putative tricarboxylic transport membrane protein
MWSNLADGFSSAIGWLPLLLVFVGALWGIIGGALPGISTSAAIALAAPITFGLDPALALIFLGAVYTGGTYGGSITATLLNTPGTPEAAIMVYDGYAMTRKGQAGKALWAAIMSAAIGGFIGTFVLIFAAAPLASVAIRFGAPEYTALAFLGLSALAFLSGTSVTKGVISVFLGIMLALVGLDPISGESRMTFGFAILLEGIPIITALIGLFAVSEAFSLITKRDSDDGADDGAVAPGGFWSDMLTWGEIKRQSKFSLLGTGIGTFIGALPGGGSTIASLISYSAAKQVSSQGANFGNGQMEGLSTPEAADKATVGGALIPTLTLGIPGSTSTAILIGLLTVNNIQPGPNLFTQQSTLVYGLFASLILANIAVLMIGAFGVPLITGVTRVPKPVLGVSILMLTMVGAYASETNLSGMWIALIFGVAGYVLKKYDFPTAPLILSLILVPLLEVNLRRALLASGGDYSVFVDRPVAFAFFLTSLLFIFVPVFLRMRRGRGERPGRGREDEGKWEEE